MTSQPEDPMERARALGEKWVAKVPGVYGTAEARAFVAAAIEELAPILEENARLKAELSSARRTEPSRGMQGAEAWEL